MPPSHWVSGTVLVSDIDTFDLAVNAGDTMFVSLDMDPADARGNRAGGTRWNGSLSLTNHVVGLGALEATDSSTQSPNSEALFATLRNDGTVRLKVRP